MPHHGRVEEFSAVVWTDTHSKGNSAREIVQGHTMRRSNDYF